MIRIGTPNDCNKYLCVDGLDAYLIHKNGIPPEWRDEDCLYFKKSKKLEKLCKKLGIEYF